MAERYPPGLHRLWYRSSGFKEGLLVEGDFRGPEGIRNSHLFTEDNDGLYYLDYDFPVLGSYAAVISENGVKKTSQNFLIEKPPSGGTRLGPAGINLLNT